MCKSLLGFRWLRVANENDICFAGSGLFRASSACAIRRVEPYQCDGRYVKTLYGKLGDSLQHFPKPRKGLSAGDEATRATHDQGKQSESAAGYPRARSGAAMERHAYLLLGDAG